jgi:hypothetical protein
MNIFASRKSNLAIALFATIVAMASNVSAETLQAFVARANNAASTTTHVLVPLDHVGTTALPFKTTAANKEIKITYNAECGVLGPIGSWQSVTILVDGVEANPTSGTSFAFCSASSTTTFIWTGAVRQSIYKVPVAGNHIVQVLVDLNAGATEWWLGDTSIVVEQQ